MADLGEFLVAIGELSDPAHAVNNARDRGVVSFVDGGPVFSGNGIPDAMEFKLLESVLKDATLDLGFEGGVMNGHVYQDWRHNLAQAQADFADFAGAPVEDGLRSPFPPFFPYETEFDDEPENDERIEGDDLDEDQDEDDFDDEEDEADEPRPTRRKQFKPAKPTLMERYAKANDYAKDGTDRFYHTNGSWIEKVSGGHRFPWERRSSGGELLQCYWDKEHCIQRDALKIDADVWKLCEQHPDKYTLLLVDADDVPLEITGRRLRDMREDGEHALYPAKCLPVYEHVRVGVNSNE